MRKLSIESINNNNIAIKKAMACKALMTREGNQACWRGRQVIG